MKKLIYFIAAAALAVSCNLDKFPADKVSSEAMTNPENAAAATNGTYSLFKTRIECNGLYSYNNTYVRHYTQLGEFKGDNVLISGKSTDPMFSDATLTEMADDYNLDYFWFISYKILYATTSVIEVIPDDTEDPVLLHIKGENYFMRAFVHMNLCQMFAFPYSLKGKDEPGVVLRVKPAQTGEVIKRSTVGEVYAAVEQDLNDAIRCMEGGSRRGDNGYVDVNAAKALLCRLYLYMNRDDECITLADQILGGAGSGLLDPDIQNLYENTRTSKEVIWCVAHDNNPDDYPDATRMTGSMFYCFGDPDSGKEGDVGDGTGWGELYYSQPLLDLFGRYPSDQRFTKLCVPLHKSKTGKKMIYWPVVCSDNYAENYIDREPVYDAIAGKYVCKDEKGNSHTVETELVGTYPRTYIMLDGKKQYVTVSDSIGCRIGAGGDMYPVTFMKKFSNQGGTPSNLASPAMLRYDEVILNRAEAYAHKNNVKALDDVNTIRRRAGIPEEGMFTAANMAERNYASLLDVVLDEKRLEFCFEGLRVFDLQRNNKPIDRRFAGRQTYEVVAPDDPRLRYWIPLSEINVSGIPQNER